MERLYLITVGILLYASVAGAFSLDFNFSWSGSRISLIDLIHNMSIDPLSNVFPGTDVGSTATQVFTLSNTGNYRAEDVAVTVTGTGFSEQSRTCAANPFVLGSMSSCTVTAGFTPSSAIFFNGSTCYEAPNIPRVCSALSGAGLSTGPTYSFYMNMDTLGTTPQVGTGPIVVGANITNSAAQVSNGMDFGKINTAAGRITFPSSGNISATQGTMGFWIKNTATANYAEWINWNTTNFLFVNSASTNYLFKYKGANTANISLPVGEWHFVELSWQSSTNKASIRRDGGTWAEILNASGTDPANVNVAIGDVTATTKQFSMDQLKISGGYQDDMYSTRNSTP